MCIRLMAEGNSIYIIYNHYIDLSTALQYHYSIPVKYHVQYDNNIMNLQPKGVGV